MWEKLVTYSYGVSLDECLLIHLKIFCYKNMYKNWTQELFV